MTRRAFLLLAVSWAALSGAWATPDAALDLGGPDFCRAVEQQTFLLINQYRLKHDLPALKWHEGIAKLARAHSRDMATGEVDFGHGGFDGRVNQLKALVAGFRGAGENVLYTEDTADVAPSAVQDWLHSPHHLQNIRGDYNLSGLGVWRSGSGSLFFTQIFLKVGEPGN